MTQHNEHKIIQSTEGVIIAETFRHDITPNDEGTLASITEWIYDVIDSHEDFDGEIYLDTNDTNTIILDDNNTNESYRITITKETN